MGCFSGRLMSAASDQKLFCKLCSPFCCSFDEYVEEKVISPSYYSAILTPPPPPDSILISRDITLPTKVCLVKVMFFSRSHVWMWVKWSESLSVMSDSLQPHGLYSSWSPLGQYTGVGSPSLLQGIFPTQGSNPGLPHCRQILYQLSHRELDYKEVWTLKNWCFWIVGWRRLLRVPWTARGSNQSILKEINPEYSLEALTLKLKCQYFWPPEVKSRLIRKDPDGRSQDGGGIGRGDHFLFYKFIERTTERWKKFTKQLLMASSGHQAPRKAAHCLRREGKKILFFFFLSFFLFFFFVFCCCFSSFFLFFFSFFFSFVSFACFSLLFPFKVL